MLKYGENCKGERHSPLQKHIENEAIVAVNPKSPSYSECWSTTQANNRYSEPERTVRFRRRLLLQSFRTNR